MYDSLSAMWKCSVNADVIAHVSVWTPDSSKQDFRLGWGHLRIIKKYFDNTSHTISLRILYIYLEQKVEKETI